MRPERWLGWMYLVTALLATASIVVPHSEGYDVVGILLVAALGVVVGAALVLTPRRPPVWVLHAATALGSILTGLIIDFTDGLPNSASIFFIWLVLYAFYVFGLAPAIAQLALVLVVYVACAVFLPAPYPLAAHSLGIAGALIGSGVIVAALKRQINGLVDALARTARTDELTGLPNRRAFNEELDRELARVERTRMPVTLAVLDLDHFKAVNDRLGHPAGDAALTRAAELIRTSIREVDIPARVGGEEFAVILPGTDARSAVSLAERIRRNLAAAFTESPVPVTVSIGLADAKPGSGVDATELQRRGDRAVYAAKENGRDRVELDAKPAEAVG